MDALAYPATRYAPPAIAHLASKAERERLSPSAVKAFFNIVKHWRLRDEDARELLGGESNGPYYNLKRAAKGSRMPARTLDADTLLRISYLIGIFKALNVLHGRALADDWIALPNTNPIFRGTTPVEYMVKGGIPAMQIVRRLLDSRRAGT